MKNKATLKETLNIYSEIVSREKKTINEASNALDLMRVGAFENLVVADLIKRELKIILDDDKSIEVDMDRIKRRLQTMPIDSAFRITEMTALRELLQILENLPDENQLEKSLPGFKEAVDILNDI